MAIMNIKLIIFIILLSLIIFISCGDENGIVDNNPIIPSNHLPVIQQQSDTSAAIGDTLRLLAIAHDDEGDSLIYYLATVLSWTEIKGGYRCNADIDHVTGQFYFIPKIEDRPERSFYFIVRDVVGGSDSTLFSVFVP